MAGDERQWPLERLLVGIDELRVVLGPEVTPHVERVKELILRALAARDRGDRPAALEAVAGAMAALAELGDRLDSAEGAMMRAVASAFIAGMAREDREAVESSLDVIQSRAGTPKKPEST